MSSPLDVVMDDLRRKVLVVAGEQGLGKTQLTKHLTEMALKLGWVAQCYDISMAWFHDSPLPYRTVANDWGSPQNRPDTLYDMATLKNMDRRILISRMIEEEWTRRVNGIRDDEDFLSKVPQYLEVFEEGNVFLDSSSLNRKDWCGDTLTNFISVRRNLKYSGIVVATAVSGEIATKFRKRCNYLIGRIMSDEERRYIKNSTSKDFVEAASDLPPYKFVYYGSEKILEPFGVQFKEFPQPQDIPSWVPDPEPPQKHRGFLHRLLNI